MWVEFMSSRLLKFAVIAIVLATLMHPLIESFDTWDGAGPTNDTELTVVGGLIAVGLVLALRRLISLALSTTTLVASLDLSRFFQTARFRLGFTPSLEFARPPLLPLRI